MDHPRDYWLACAVYDAFRGVPLRKLIARGYLDLAPMEREQRDAVIRLGGLFFQGRSWRRFGGELELDAAARLTEEQQAELQLFHSFRFDVGEAFAHLLADDKSLSPTARDVTLERLETMGLLPVER